MKLETIDLYKRFDSPRPEGTSARLLCWRCDTPSSLAVRRERPAVLILPGGGYNHTSEREAEPVALRFAGMGYVSFVLHYSCAPHAFPIPLREAAMAIRYIREEAERLDVGPDQVAALGFSAGGHLCGLLGTLYDAPEVGDIGPAELLRPDALCLCYPVSLAREPTHEESMRNISGGDGALRDRLSLDRLVRRDMPPVFLWHTRDDASVPCRGTLMLAAALEEAGIDFSLYLYRRGRHGLSTADAQVYPANAVPEVSWDVPGWLEAAGRFFAGCGFAIRDSVPCGSPTLSPPVERLRELIEKRCADPAFRLEQEIARMPFNDDYLRKRFQKEVGVSPLKYMTQLRMKRASALLKDGLYSIAEIAERCGFSDALYFSRAFKKYFGCSPTVYAKGGKAL